MIANNPKFKGGSIDVDACAKATSFIVLCDSFNVPIVFLVDQPGFMIGIEGEKRGAPGRIMNWVNALSLISVPRVSITLRKNYGQAYLNMGGGRNSDEVGRLADRRFRFHGSGDRSQRAPSAVAVKMIRSGSSKLLEEIARDSAPWPLAALYEAQAIIDPRETRQCLVQLLDVHRTRLGSAIGKHLLANWPTSY